MSAVSADVAGRPEAHNPGRVLPIRQLLAELKAVVANAPIALFAFDTKGILTVSEGRSIREVGLDPEAHLGSSVFEIFQHTPLPVMARRALKGETCSSSTFMAEWGRTFETTYSPMLDEEGQVIGAIGVSIDVTSRVEAERARAENEAKSRFLAGMSHELRTPLTSVLGFAQLLEEPKFGRLNPRQQRYVGHILASGRHLLNLVNDLLDLSRIAAGKLELHLELFRLDALVETAAQDIAPLAESAKVTITARESGCVVYADCRATHQILVNLLSNAVKFTPAGGSIEIGSVESEEGCALTVTDSGQGIPAEFLPRLFDEFTQVDPTRSGAAKGSGLGLSLSRGLAEAMGGRLSVESELGSGSRFELTLPSRA